MVEKESFLYLFVGLDSLAKHARLNKLKESLLSAKTRDFNLDTLYAPELTLKLFQERIMLLPSKARKRVIIIKQAEHLKEEIREYIWDKQKELKTKIVLILDADSPDKKNDFLRRAGSLGVVYTFGSSPSLDTFSLSRQIEQKKADMALRTLSQLFKEGERPERIMGGLRYSWERISLDSRELKRRLLLLLQCDLEIKRGRLNPEFALEKLVIGLCALGKPKR